MRPCHEFRDSRRGSISLIIRDLSGPNRCPSHCSSRCSHAVNHALTAPAARGPGPGPARLGGLAQAGRLRVRLRRMRARRPPPVALTWSRVNVTGCHGVPGRWRRVNTTQCPGPPSRVTPRPGPRPAAVQCGHWQIQVRVTDRLGDPGPGHGHPVPVRDPQPVAVTYCVSPGRTGRPPASVEPVTQ